MQCRNDAKLLNEKVALLGHLQSFEGQTDLEVIRQLDKEIACLNRQEDMKWRQWAK